MSLAENLRNNFNSGVRQRGNKYFWEKRVRIQSGSAEQVTARVRGGRTYEVRLELDRGDLFAACDCAYFDSGEACKHIWATIMAAEQSGYLSAATTPELILEFDELREEYDYRPVAKPVPRPAPPPPPPVWKTELSRLLNAYQSPANPANRWPANRQIVYVLDPAASESVDGVILGLATQDLKANGLASHIYSVSLKRSLIAHLPLEEDREIISALAGAPHHYGWGYARIEDQLPESWLLDRLLASTIVPKVLRTGRCYLRDRVEGVAAAAVPASWDDGEAWTFGLELRHLGKHWTIQGVLRRGEEKRGIEDAAIAAKAGLVFMPGSVARLARDTHAEWVRALRYSANELKAPEKDKEQFLETLLCSPGLPPLEVPEELRYEEVSPAPRPALRIAPPDPAVHSSNKLRAELSFDYEGRSVRDEERSRGFYEAASRRFIRRDPGVEDAARALLAELGARHRNAGYSNPEPGWEIAPAKLPRIVASLVQAGWHIEAEGKVFRRPGAFHIQVSSGIDWFELHGGVDYGETTAKLPELLEALRRGENMVRLGDGTYGVLPQEWLRRIGLLAGAGTPEDGHLRFRPSQAGLLDALLASQPEARCDEAFDRLRKELRAFQGIRPAPQPAGFVGSLRDYQREGLGWMEFLRRFSFGGCLADDMGVGKTAQVLALLETRRERRADGERLGPSLVVMPRSLVFNWKQEAERFTPQLRVLDHTGVTRAGNELGDCDVVLTTYGTLRRDIARMKDIEFDYVILDEAQAIKNAATASAKAVRLLKARQRLALSGTPVENHLGELWSLFEFLNPGMLGTASVFKLATGVQRSAGGETSRMLAQALRPFILRRTKQQVARELPPKAEQTVYCELEPPQRRVYNELRQHYRDTLLNRVDAEGLGKSKIQVLEALLRLRQAACHPGLLDPKRRRDSSAKLEMLLEQVRQVVDEGHKALIFSQFTSLLAIVREHLDEAGLVYEYLDGETRDRGARVDRFQTDPDCPLFLISLKAGGLGLNLTAAEYVFLLDPWWNPAVEAQAVDRTHRIGQTRQVFAYRLIARDTVEEKVLELQKSKRDLAAAIIGENNSLIRDLRREDLELLLS